MYLFINNKPCYKVSELPETTRDFDPKCKATFITVDLKKHDGAGMTDIILDNWDSGPSEIITFKLASISSKNVLARGSICSD